MKKEAKLKIYSQIESKLIITYNQKGFRSKKIPFQFYRNGFTVLMGASSEYDDSITIRPSFSVKNETIQETLTQVNFPNRLLQLTSKRVQNSNFAHEFGVTEFDNSSFNFVGEEGLKYASYYYSIEENTNLTPIVEDHINFMEKVGFRYFEALSTIHGINEYFNNRLLGLSDEFFENPTKKEEIGDSFQKEEVLSAIVAAHLEKDERYKKIVERYKKIYSNNDWYLEDIETLVEYLNQNPT
ncbi:hypothetical protein K6119_15705 [Paracrocinitomix mangrovi]|uniref:hypothetical protein n=1 Tax=Paracrocinitomix mangrovi TaxID=2862509 RepID=UPI001C8E781E|nr:hypothetical protein [Paracrocinitomix mangrovi]UKN01175.1 hypothetical protein K6119_15705 [Paracrocinitomix mangrovi]